MLLDAVNALSILVGITAMAESTVPLVPDNTMLPMQLGQVKPIRLTAYNRFGADSDCVWHGVVTPYDRDWAEERSTVAGMPEIVPAEPGKMAGRAVIVTEKVCGTTRTPVALVDSVRPWGVGIGEANRIDGLDLTKTPEQARPRWLAQAAQRLDTAGFPEKAAVARTPMTPIVE